MTQSQLRTVFSLQSQCVISYYFFTTVLGVHQLSATRPGLWLERPQDAAEHRHPKSQLTAIAFLSPQAPDGWELGPDGKMSLAFGF